MARATQVGLICSGHSRPVVDLAFSPLTPDGYFLVSACKDGKPMLRAGKTGDWIGTFEGHKGAVWCAVIDRPALRVATGSADFSAKVWDAVSGGELHALQHPHIVKSVDFDVTSSHLLTGCNDKTLRVFDLGRPDAAPRVLTGHTAPPKRAAFCADGVLALSVGEDKRLFQWDLRTGAVAQSLPVADAFTSLEISLDGSIVTTTHGNVITIRHGSTLAFKKEFKCDCLVFSASVHPDQTTLVWGGFDNLLHVVDCASAQHVEAFKGHFGPVHSVRYSPDGELCASGSEDGTVRLWQTRAGTEYGLWRRAPTANDATP